LDVFSYINAEPQQFDHDEYEEAVEIELKHHLNGHRSTRILRDQLVDISRNGYVEICGFKHPYNRSVIYWRMEEVINNIAKRKFHKPFSRNASYLYNKNIYHVHHSQTFYSLRNCVRYIEKKYPTDDAIWRRLEQLRVEHPDVKNLFPIFSNELLLESVSWDNKTGEWIVYQKSGENLKFLCLYIHDVG